MTLLMLFLSQWRKQLSIRDFYIFCIPGLYFTQKKGLRGWYLVCFAKVPINTCSERASRVRVAFQKATCLN